MNILLINPPRSPENALLDHAPAEAKRFIHKLIGPPLGLLTVASAVKDYNVAVLDLKGEYDLNPDAPPPRELVAQALQRTNPGIVGVTFIASELPAGLEIFRTVKAHSPETLTVAGGLHTTLCPEHFNDPAVDVVCPGPSAHTFRELVRAVETGRAIDHVGGILARAGDRLVPSPAPVPPCDPAGRGFIAPDRSHLKRWLPTYVVGRATGPSTYVFTSLGCPYKCSFCSIWPQYQGRYFQRDVESVIEELKTVDEYEVVRFADANTLVNLEFAERLFDRIVEEGIRKVFIMDIRVDTAAQNPALIEKLARGGLKVAIVGLESFRQEELQRYHKSQDANLIAEAIRVLHQNDIMIRGNYIIPPDYGPDDFRALGDFAAAHSTAYASYTILTPMPGTAFYEEVRDRIVDHDLAKYNLFNCVMKTRLPLDAFYEQVGALWLVRKGNETL